MQAPRVFLRVLIVRRKKAGEDARYSTIMSFRNRGGNYPRPVDYSAASFSITTFKCAVTSLCSFTGTVNSPSVLSGS